jgi:hypothetical protein
MYFQKYLAFLFIIGMFVSCKNDDGPVENNGLVGKWKLVEVLSAPGPGPADFRKVNEAESGTIEFKSSGDFREIKGPIFSSINPCDQYKTLDNNKLELSVKSNQPAYSTTWYIIEISPRNLTLGFDCSGFPCASKYVAIR